MLRQSDKIVRQMTYELVVVSIPEQMLYRNW